jgi:type IV pilus assembly protein PilC
MLTYKVTARDPANGKKIVSEVEAPNEKGVSEALKAQGLAPIEIVEIGQSSAGSVVSKFTGRVRTKDKVIFSRQLSTLINAGLPLVQSLNTVVGQTTSKPLKSIIHKVIADVEAGTAFSTALEKYPNVFNRVYVSLIAAGESSGTLDKALERLANQQEKDAEILAKVRGAMMYPAIVLAVMIGVLTFMLVKVLPQVQEIYKGLPGVQLPFLTRMLLSVSQFIIHFWYIVIILVVIAIFVTTRWARTGPGKEVIDGLKMHAWPVGPLFMKLYMARFARTGTTLVASGVPLLQMLSITSDAVDNVHISRSIDAAAEKVKGGKALSETLTGDPNFLELVPNMIKVGEQSGALENMLDKTADYYEKEVDNQIKAISTIIEPVLMVIMGIMALIIVAAILLPIYGLVGKNIIR